MIPTQAIRAGLALMIATVATVAPTGLDLAGQPGAPTIIVFALPGDSAGR